MEYYLTSSPVIYETRAVNPANGFIPALRDSLRSAETALMISSDPEGHAKTDFYSAETRRSLEDVGIRFRSWSALDSRNEADAAALVRGADFIILAGGHVPTQNAFFQRIGLRDLLRDWDGVLMGISAGTMNCAATVYAQPELPGEALDPAYRRFLPGLGLTKVNLLPHYDRVKDDVLDGLRLFEDITCPDSRGRTFYAIPDGSYLFIEGGRTELRGEAYRIRDGRISQISRDGQTVFL